MTEDRVGRLARRLARSEPQIYRSNGGATAPGESAFDGVARALVAPVTRRRAVVMISGAVLASSLLRPRRARAAAAACECPHCWPYGPKLCQSSKGARVCVANDLQCCSNDNCAIACPYPWRDCTGPARCDDTRRMCFDTTNPQYDKARTQFCSHVATVPNGCVDSHESEAVRGWCCQQFETCGDSEGDCSCPSTVCAGKCCPPDKPDCVNGFCKPPCDPGFHYDTAGVCRCDSGSACGVGSRRVCCADGSICQGGRCVKPQEPDIPLLDSFRNLFNMAGQSNAAHGGGGTRSRFARAAALGPVSTALLELSAVSGLEAAVGLAFSARPVDRAYRRRVVATKPRLPKLAAGPGLDARAARALDALLAAEARGFALGLAAARSLAKARGALRRHDQRLARKQVLAAAGFADQSAKVLRTVPALRAKAVAALRSTGTAEVAVSAGDLAVELSAVNSGGLPADLAALLKRLEAGGDDLKRLRGGLRSVTPADGGVLIAPLADARQTSDLRSLATKLARFARSARRSPIRRARGRPLRYTPR